MANQWALLSGINQYPDLQPLMYAQADAVGLRNFFVDEVGIPVHQCLLLTDLSAAIEPYAHYPVGQTWRSQLEDICHNKVQSGDTLWIFFSGYGVHQGGQDYLLPIDGDGEQLETTALSLTWVLETLKGAATDQILVVLDMNRSQGASGPQTLGQQTAELARDFGIPLLLACQPQQYSHETMAVRQGLFTQALLEGLRYHGCVTLSQLAAYVEDRVPELSQHHWRPIQNPVTVIPAAQKFMLVLPAAAVAQLPMTEQAEARQAQPPLPPPPLFVADGAANGEPGPDAALVSQRTERTEPSYPAEAGHNPGGTPTGGADPTEGQETATFGSDDRAVLWNWGIAGAALVLLLGVFLRYQPLLRQTNSNPAPAETTETAPPIAAETPASGPEDQPAPPPAAVEGAPDPGPEVAEESTAPPPQSALERATSAIALQRYGEARAWLDLVPVEQRDEAYQTLVQQAQGGEAQAVDRNQAILDEARRQIQPVSASVFNDAIETARQIPPEDPFYDQAQADIDRWSRIILDLAEGRAATGDINGAIAAAQLVPADRPTVHQQAQARIARWQQQAANRQRIQQAQASLQPGQASSFQKAIEQLLTITPDQPEYQTARDRILQWSEDILVIARARAAQSRFSEAIAAAQLVPEQTPVYDQAQAEIQRWQSQL
jgi:uncharacterized caspase-like protein